MENKKGEEPEETIYTSAIQIGWLKSIDGKLRTIIILLVLIAILVFMAFVLTFCSTVLS